MAHKYAVGTRLDGLYKGWEQNDYAEITFLRADGTYAIEYVRDGMPRRNLIGVSEAQVEDIGLNYNAFYPARSMTSTLFAMYTIKEG